MQYKNHPTPPLLNDDNSYYDGSNLSILLFIFICLVGRLWYSILCNNCNNNENQRNINENLLQNESNSENNQNHQNNQNQTIEKIELTFTNNLNNKNCSICLDEFNENEILFQLICNHYYHKKCINDWLRKNRSCPLCRTDLV